MGDANEFIQNVLAHYASEFYDPVKAHEYYIKNRELKARRSGSDLKTDSKKQAWTYAQNQIKEAETSAITEASKNRDAAFEMIREASRQRLEKTRTMLQDFFKQVTETYQTDVAKLSEGLKAETERIITERNSVVAIIDRNHSLRMTKVADELAAKQKLIIETAQKKLDSLPEIPEGISKTGRARLLEQRAKKVAQIRGGVRMQQEAAFRQATTARQQITERTKSDRKSVIDRAKSDVVAASDKARSSKNALSEFARSEKETDRQVKAKDREYIKIELTNAINNARSSYESLKGEIKARYESARDTEYEAIKRSV